MKSSYALGLFFIFLVSVIWSVASIVVQYLYRDQDFHSPFLLTYIGTTLFVTLLPSRLLWERRKRIQRLFCKCFWRTPPEEGVEIEIIPWRNSDDYQEVPSVAPTPNRSDSEASSNISHHPDLKSVENMKLQPAEKVHQSERPTVDNYNHSAEATGEMTFRVLSHEDHFKMALKIAPVWFLANWCYNTSLALTSITSSTVLASTGSLFTFLFAVSIGDEGFTYLKLSGVLLGIMGSILTGLHDVQSTNSEPGLNVTDLWNTSDNESAAATQSPSPTQDWQDNQRPIWGDIVGLLSAIGYGAYTVLIRQLCPRNEDAMSMQLLLGYVGLLNGLVLLPIAVKLVLSTGNEATVTSVDDDVGTSTWTSQPHQQLTWVVFGYLVAKGMLDNVLSDYLWARAVVLTSATVATVGLGLTIPMAFASDWILLGHANVLSWESVVGALAVLSGFILVNLDGHNENEQQDEGHDVPVTNEEAQPVTQGVPG